MLIFGGESLKTGGLPSPLEVTAILDDTVASGSPERQGGEYLDGLHTNRSHLQLEETQQPGELPSLMDI